MSLNVAEFVIGQISLLAWREGSRLSPGCRPAALGIAQVIRNRVEAGWHAGDWLKILHEVPIHSAEEIVAMDWRSMPDIYDQDFRWLYGQIGMVYDRTLPDSITCGADVNWAAHPINATKSQPRKGLFYCNLQMPIRPWFLETVVRNPAEHPRQAEAGTVIFYG